MNDPQIKDYRLVTPIPTTRFSAPNQAAFVFKGYFPSSTDPIVIIGMWNPYLGAAEHFLNVVMDKYGSLQNIQMSVVVDSRSTPKFQQALMKAVAQHEELSNWYIVKTQRNPQGKVTLTRDDYFSAEAFDIDANGRVQTKIKATQTTIATTAKTPDKAVEHHPTVGVFLRKLIR